MKFLPVGAELFHVDGNTDMTNLIVAFRNFVNEPKNYKRLFSTTDAWFTVERVT